MQHDSGKLWLDGDVIRYRSKTYGTWELPLEAVRIVGEATNEDGPFADDYWFCIAASPERWFEASFYADGREEFLEDLGRRLGAPLENELAHSTTFESRILWPPDLRGEPMFTYTDVVFPWYRRWFTLPRNEQTFTSAVRRHLEAPSASQRDHAHPDTSAVDPQ